MVAQADPSGRTILFNLKIGTDPGNQAAVNQFVKSITDAVQKQITTEIKYGTRSSPNLGGMGGGGMGGGGSSPPKPGSSIDWGKLAAANVKPKTPEEIAAEKAEIANKRRVDSAMRLGANLAKIEEQNASAFDRMGGGGGRGGGGGSSTFRTVNEMREGLTSAAHGAIQLARGLALLGASSEKDLEKFTHYIAAIESFTSMAGGSLQIYTGLAKAVHQYSAATQAATQAVLANAAAERAADAARSSRLAQSGATNAILRRAGQTGSPMAAAAAQETIMRRMAQTESGSYGRLSEGSKAIAAAPSVGILGKIGAAAAPLAVPAAIGTAIAVAIVAALQGPGLWRDLAGKNQSQKDFDRMKKASDDAAAMRDMQGQQAGARARFGGQVFDMGLGSMRMGLESRAMASNLTGLERERSVNLNEGLALERIRLELTTAQAVTKTVQEREEINRRIGEVNSRLLDNARESQRLAKQEAEDKIRGAKETLASLKEEMGERRKSMEAIQERFLSAKQKFGNMNPEEQDQVLAAGRTMNRANELLDAAKGNRNHVSARMGFDLLNTISPEMREKLQGLGLTGTETAMRDRALESAHRKGFDRVFGREESKALGIEERAAAALQVKIDRQVNVIVKAEQDNDALARKLADDAALQYQRMEQGLLATFRRELDQRMQQINRNNGRRGEASVAAGR